MEVHFAREGYVVAAGGTVEVAVVVSYEPGEAADLFSYGVRLVMGGGGAVSVESVEVPPELNYLAWSPGALVDLSPEVTGVKGNTWITKDGVLPYAGSLLATFTLVGLEPGVVDLGLEFFRTAGRNEDVFVTTDGTTLDSSIVFGSATLTVVGAPALEITRMPPGRVRIGYAMAPGFRYVLRRSEDLEEWAIIAETVGGAAAAISLEFLTNPYDRAFFRLEAMIDGS